MRLRLLSTLLCLSILFCSCVQVNSPESNQAAISATIDTADIAILAFDQTFYLVFNEPYKPTSLSTSDIIEVDNIMKRYISDSNERLSEEFKHLNSIDFKKYKYKRQYIAAINDKGEKVVWVNGFCHESDKAWKTKIVLVNDGGNCYFNLKVNLSTKKCFDISVNGYA